MPLLSHLNMFYTHAYIHTHICSVYFMYSFASVEFEDYCKSVVCAFLCVVIQFTAYPQHSIALYLVGFPE